MTVAPRSHRRQRISFTVLLRFCAHSSADAEIDENPGKECAVDKERESLEKLLAWDESKVRYNADVIRDAQAKKISVHSAILMDFGHLKHSYLAEQQQNIQRTSGALWRQCQIRHRMQSTLHRTRSIRFSDDSITSSRHNIVFTCNGRRSHLLFQHSQPKLVTMYEPDDGSKNLSDSSSRGCSHAMSQH